MTKAFWTCVALLLQTGAQGCSDHFLSFGDSWAYLGGPILADLVSPCTGETEAIPGMPVALLPEQALKNALDARPNVTTVWLSIGGDDFLEGSPIISSLPPIPGIDPQWVLNKDMLPRTEKLLEAAWAAHPHVSIAMFGYELLDWDGSSFCQGFEYEEFSRFECPGEQQRNVSCATHAQARLLQFEYVDALQRKYGATRPFQGLNLLGTLQQAGGVPDATPGHPNFDYYSPDEYVRQEGMPWGCVHLTTDGFRIVLAEMVKQGGLRGAAPRRRMLF